MKVCINKDKCEGHKRCYGVYPDLFEEGADHKGKVRAGMETVPDDFEMDAQSAANACPEGAISIEY
ncbi:MAG: ferredoxin [Pseudomonadales bacterium]